MLAPPSRVLPWCSESSLEEHRSCPCRSGNVEGLKPGVLSLAPPPVPVSAISAGVPTSNAPRGGIWGSRNQAVSQLQRFSATHARVLPLFVKDATAVRGSRVVGVIALFALTLLHIIYVDIVATRVTRQGRLPVTRISIAAAGGPTKQATKKTHISPSRL